METSAAHENAEGIKSVGIRLLEEYLDKVVFILMRDNTTVEGILRSYDQYYNVLLENAKEMTVLEEEYSVLESETVLLRGENIVLLGEGSITADGKMKKIEHSEIMEKVKLPADDLDYIAL
ncbi:U6 snRNA-associated Sm-like protein LSm1 [Nematocida minor]|uniref:U6 snRNA-associated Sm-like protein LSm1 n=1 Tax=Nematocida minor TaxID=1912983 RepID=UPI0022207A77|nr:U6 snRNA-associated Sm-like protein LSm1 [Nematocida minor]KAI5189216.1 U6 snRNA-associated Sm-like protein LSm1 [Nematocida minor]